MQRYLIATIASLALFVWSNTACSNQEIPHYNTTTGITGASPDATTGGSTTSGSPPTGTTTGSSTGGSTSTCTAATATATETVTLANTQFAPTCILISVGDSVSFVNNDTVAHRISTDAGQALSFDLGNQNPNTTLTQDFNQTGTFTLNCQYHPTMHMTVIVQGSTTTGGTTSASTTSGTTTTTTTAGTSTTTTTTGGGTSTSTTTGGTNGSSCTSTNATATSAITLTGFQFSPTCAQVTQGTTVTFTNNDSASHQIATATGQPETFTLPTQGSGISESHTFNTAGTYSIVCNFHSNMHLTLIVE